MWPLKTKKYLINLAALLVTTALFLGCRKESSDKDPKKLNPSSPRSGIQPKSKSLLAAPDKKTGSLVKGEFQKFSTERLLDWIDSKRIPGSITNQYLDACNELARRDPLRALEILCTTDRIEESACYFKIITVNLSEQNPDALASWLRDTLPSITQNRSLLLSFYSQGLASLSLSSPDTALNVLRSSVSDPTIKERCLLSIFQAIGGADAEKALAMAERSDDGVNIEKLRAAVAIGAAKLQPEMALAIGKEISNASERAGLYGTIFREWLQRDPKMGAALLQTLPDSDFEGMLKRDFGGTDSIVSILANTNPDTLLKKMAGLTPSSSNSKLFGDMIAALTPNNSTGVINAINSLPNSQLKDDLISQTFNSIGESATDAQSFMRLAPEDPSSRAKAIEGYANAVGQMGFSSVVDFAKQLDLRDRGEFIQASISSICGPDLNRTAELVTSKDGVFGDLSDQQRNQLARNLGERLAIADSNRALDWYSDLPSNLQIDAMKGLSSEMVKSDIVGFSKWLGNQPHNPAWIAGAEVIIRDLKYSDPDMADEWTKLVNKEKLSK